MRSVLVLGARRMQLPLIDAARRMGLRVLAADPDFLAPGLARVHAHAVLDLADFSGCLDFARAERIEGILTIAADYPMPTLARLCEAMGLPGPSPEAVLRATNKREMRRAFERAGVPSPRSIPASSLEQAGRAVHDLDSTAVVKPGLSSGGRGVTCLPADAPPEAVETAFTSALEHSRSGEVLIEEFVEGPEYSVETITHGGRTHVVAVTDKITTGVPHFVEVGHSQPSALPADARAAVEDAARRAVEALGLDACAGHTEVRLSPRGPCVIETGGRLGGGYITSHLVPLAHGVALMEEAIRVDLNLARPGETLVLLLYAAGAAAGLR